ncbi:MAG: hypothetical protein VKJ05_06450 [Synechococcaceae cyanobacterium]|nr:hypothetical protein [Synechococcaceae cyanobacterium]
MPLPLALPTVVPIALAATLLAAAPAPALPLPSAVPGSGMLPVSPVDTPLPADAFAPYTPPRSSLVDEGGLGGSVETFDPIGRAELIAARIPRFWRGSYRPFERGAAARPVQLRLDSVVPDGQMVVLRGRMKIAEAESAFVANINAKSDQLDLIPLTETLDLGIEPGGTFQGLQGVSLSGWNAPRFVTPGGRLQLVPGAPPPPAASSGGVIRGLW